MRCWIKIIADYNGFDSEASTVYGERSQRDRSRSKNCYYWLNNSSVKTNGFEEFELFEK